MKHCGKLGANLLYRIRKIMLFERKSTEYSKNSGAYSLFKESTSYRSAYLCITKHCFNVVDLKF